MAAIKSAAGHGAGYDQISTDDDSAAERPAAAEPPLRTLAALATIFGMAYPIAASSLLDRVGEQISTMLVGQLGPAQLGAVSTWLHQSLAQAFAHQMTGLYDAHPVHTFVRQVTLGRMWVNVTGFSLCFGGMSALDTLASQAYGAENYAMVGTWAQRGCVLLSLMCLPIGCLWAFGTAPMLWPCGATHTNTSGPWTVAGTRSVPNAHLATLG